MSIIKSILEKLKLKELFAILFMGAIIITFLPKELAEKIRIADFRASYQTYISIGMILIGSYYLLCIIEWGKKYIWRKTHSTKKIAIKYMTDGISTDEMQLLIEKFYDKNNKMFHTTGSVDMNDGRKAALESKFILYRSASVSSFYTEFAYNLQPYALEFLNKNLQHGNIKITSTSFEYNLQ